jgi:two-component system, LytTR family, sensor kinase
MNTTKQPTNENSDIVRVNDIGFRVILIPFFGIAIPLISGMVNIANFSNWQIKLSFLYTIAVAFIVWEGNRYLFFSLRSYFDWYNKPVKKIFAVLFAIFFYTIPAAVLMLVGWYKIFSDGKTDWNIVFTSTLIILICVIFITHVYETVFMVKEAESEKVQRAQVEQAKAEAELEALKNQVDPHFIFNSLNTLSHLMEAKPAKAKQFNDSLADVYRYILHSKGRDLVTLGEEMKFLEDYFSLLKIRFENAVQLNNNIKHESADNVLVPPISLQVLVENAVKHNEFSDIRPLLIQIEMNDEELVVHNKINRKLLKRSSSEIGLRNLNDRYLLTTKKRIIIKEDEKDFTVILPILKID